MPSPNARGALPALLATALLCATPALAVPLDVQIGNAPSSQDGTYINAGDVANTMAFTTVYVAATGSASIVEPVDLATSLFGPTVFGLWLDAPTISILGDVAMGAGDMRFVNAGTINLSGTISDNGVPLDYARLLMTPAGGTVQVNVDGTGSPTQGGWLAYANPGTAVLMDILGGSHDELVNVWANMQVGMAGGAVENLTLYSGAVVDWTGGQILGSYSTGIFGFGGTVNVYGSGFQLAVNNGNCAALPESAWSAAPGQVTNASHCLRGLFGDSTSFMTTFQTNGTMNFIPLATVPVPAAAWLLASALAGLGALRRLSR